MFSACTGPQCSWEKPSKIATGLKATRVFPHVCRCPSARATWGTPEGRGGSVGPLSPHLALALWQSPCGSHAG